MWKSTATNNSARAWIGGEGETTVPRPPSDTPNTPTQKAPYQSYPASYSTKTAWTPIIVMVVIFVILLVLVIVLLVLYVQKKGCKKKDDKKKDNGPLKTCCECPTYPECWCLKQHNLFSTIENVAVETDPNLLQPWGVAIQDCCVVTPCQKCHKSKCGCDPDESDHGCGKCKKKKCECQKEWSENTNVWVAVSQNGSLEKFLTSCRGCELKYDSSVTVPFPVRAQASHPTGVVTNCDSSKFTFTGNNIQGSAQVIAVTLEGTIVAYNSTVDPLNAYTVLDGGANRVFTGVDLVDGKLYVAEFKNSNIEVYDSTWTLISTFTDTSLTAVNYAPFNVKIACGKLYVAYAEKDQSESADVPGAGHGYVDVFSLEGGLLHRLVNRGALNSPWGLVLVCDGSILLVGNKGDGKIHAYSTEKADVLLHALHDQYRNTISNENLLGLALLPDHRCKKWKCLEDCEDAKKQECCGMESLCCCGTHSDKKNGSCGACKSKKGNCPTPTLVFAAGIDPASSGGLLGVLGCCSTC